jgi:hypothetical protein
MEDLLMEKLINELLVTIKIDTKPVQNPEVLVKHTGASGGCSSTPSCG